MQTQLVDVFVTSTVDERLAYKAAKKLALEPAIAIEHAHAFRALRCATLPLARAVPLARATQITESLAELAIETRVARNTRRGAHSLIMALLLAVLAAGAGLVWTLKRASVVNSNDSTRKNSGAPPRPDLRPSLDRVISRGKAATVTTRCARTRGSGFVIRPNLIATNAHVLCQPDDPFFVRFSDGHDRPATVVVRDTRRDLALLRVATGAIRPLSLGDATQVYPDDEALIV